MTVTYELLEEYTGTRSQEMPDPDNEGETITSEVDCRDISVRFTSDTPGTGTVFWAWAFNSAAVSYTAPQLSGTQWQINVGGQYYGYPSTATITSTSSTAPDGTTYTDRTTDIQRYEANTTTNYINGSLPSQPSVGDPYPSISFSNFYGTTD